MNARARNRTGERTNEEGHTVDDDIMEQKKLISLYLVSYKSKTLAMFTYSGTRNNLCAPPAKEDAFYIFAKVFFLIILKRPRTKIDVGDEST